MKILHTIGGFGLKSGGTSTCTYDLIKNISQERYNTDVLTPSVKDDLDKIIGEGEEWIKIVENDCITPFAYSKNIKKYLRNNYYDIYHTNGMWLYCNHITCKIAQKTNKPYIITPHGMLYPQALKRSKWKKMTMLKLFFNNDIKNATCIHATCLQEMRHIRDFGYKGDIAVIPNPANLPKYIHEIANNKITHIKNNIKTFGFLGRLHPRKNVESLIYAVNKINNKDIKIIIIGKGDIEYEQFLRDEVKRLKLEKIVEFKGFLNGREKFEELSKLTCLCVPSEFENFGMIVTEALSVRTPVIANLGTPWEELNIHNCGWWIDCSIDNIATTMNKIINMSNNNIINMGENAEKLVYNKYNPQIIAEQMQTLYSYIINGGDKPKFIY